MSETPFVFNGVLSPVLINDGAVAAAHRLADAAKTGDWPAVFGLLDRKANLLDINWWRPGGPAWFTVLHQAAWHGAPADVASELVRRGALRSLTDAKRQTPYDVLLSRQGTTHAKVAVGQRTPSTAVYLMPPPSPLAPRTIAALDQHLAEVIDGRIRGKLYAGRDPRELLRYPSVAILHELPDRQLYFPVPGMYGGFHIVLRDESLDVRSSCLAAPGTGEMHLVTEYGVTLVDKGFG